MDKAKILRLCNEIEMIMCEIYNTGHTMQNCDYEAVDKRLKAIVAEISTPPKSNADRIRQMTDEELAHFMVIQAIMGAIFVNGIQDKAAADKIVKEIIMEHKADEDISNALRWLKQEVSEDAGTDD